MSFDDAIKEVKAREAQQDAANLAQWEAEEFAKRLAATTELHTSAMRYPLAFDGVWWSLQGEGHLRGFQMAFVRLAGCSVGCPACDTDYKAHSTATAEEIAAKVDEVCPPIATERWVWITGGEPADHDLVPLLQAFKRLPNLGKRPVSVAVATSGHKRVIPPVDWLSVSPHDPIRMVQMYGNELKIVPGLNGLGISDFLRVIPIQRFLYLYVQPLWDVKNNEEDKASLRECLDFISLKENANWALSRQDHKHWGKK